MTVFEYVIFDILIYFSGVILAAVVGAIVDAQTGSTAKDDSIYVCYGSYITAVILLFILLARLSKFIPLKIYKYINKRFLCSH
jgi:hypothetical protein